MKVNNEKLLEIVQAANKGKTIQVCVTIKGKKEWRDIDHLMAGFGAEAYRIKPEPKLVKGAAYLVWDEGGEKHIAVYLGEYKGRKEFGEPYMKAEEDGCVWDNYELFVQPEALRGEE